jgi:hypothetical protein
MARTRPKPGGELGSPYTIVFDLGSEGSSFLFAPRESEFGELLKCEGCGRGMAKMLSFESASAEEGSVEVDPNWPWL